MNKKSYIVFISACMVLLLAMFLYKNSFSKINEYNFWVNHTTEVIFCYDSLSNDLKGAEMMPFYNAFRSNKILEHYTGSMERISEDITHLKLLTSDNAIQISRMDSISSLVKQHILTLESKHITDTTGMADYFRLRQLIHNGIATERKLLLERKTILNISTRRTGLLLGLFTAAAIVLIIGIAISNLYHVGRRKKAEQFLQAVLNTSQNAIVTMVAIRENQVITDFRIVYANDSTEKHIGFKPNELVGKTLLSVSPQASGKGLLQKYIHVCETGERNEFENHFMRDNVNRSCRILLAKLNDGITSTLYDITDLKNSQQELQLKVTQLEQTNNELEQFAYVASHDLQEPLRKIKTFTSMVIDRSEEPADSFTKVYLGKIFNSANRMSTLISDLLNLTDLSKQQGSFMHVDLNKILQNVLNDFELTIREKNAVVTIDDLQFIEAIPLQMNQLFYNLLNNALKFTHADRPPVLSVKQVPVSQQELVQYKLNPALTFQKIIVTDNGIGFNAEYSHKIFTIFQRLHSSSVYSGSGIGLALCKKIIKKHHGEIYGCAKQHEGASFHIILPLEQPLEHREAAVTSVYEK